MSTTLMEYDLLTAEQDAIKSLMELFEQAKRCQQLHDRAHMTLPEPLKRMLGMSTNGSKKAVASIPPPERPPLPVGAQSDWVSIPIASAYPTSLALALLGKAGEPVPARDLVASVLEIRPDIPRGSVNNIGTRLDGTLITRSKEGWELASPETAPIISDGMVWGAPAIFHKTELAVHRKEAVLHLIRTIKAGLQTMQIVEHLQNCSWVHAPINKDLVQDDVQYWLKEGKIKKSGNSGKWVVKRERESKD